MDENPKLYIITKTIFYTQYDQIETTLSGRWKKADVNKLRATYFTPIIPKTSSLFVEKIYPSNELLRVRVCIHHNYSAFLNAEI